MSVMMKAEAAVNQRCTVRSIALTNGRMIPNDYELTATG